MVGLGSWAHERSAEPKVQDDGGWYDGGCDTAVVQRDGSYSRELENCNSTRSTDSACLPTVHVSPPSFMVLYPFSSSSLKSHPSYPIPFFNYRPTPPPRLRAPPSSSIMLTLPFLLLLSILSLSSAADVCATSYDSCGAGVIGVPQLPCCDPDFYCFTSGHYFSQCRPKSELTSSSSDVRLQFCASDYAVCGSGAEPNEKLSCCDPNYTCVPVPPFFWQCMPQITRTTSQVRRNSNLRDDLFSPYALDKGTRRMEGGDNVVMSRTPACFVARLSTLGDAQQKLLYQRIREGIGGRGTIQVLDGLVRVCADQHTNRHVAMFLAHIPHVLHVERES